jgi:two-component system phosphate regulon sensor histidine kinase PhoR
VPRKGLLWKLLPAFLLCAAIATMATDRFGTVTGLIIGLLTAVITAYAAIRPVRQFFVELRQAADDVAAGQYERRIYAPDIAEAAELAEAMTRSAAAAGRRLDGAQRLNHEQEAVLAGMAEGVLAVDGDRRVISLNRAATRMLGALATEAVGRDLREVVRNPDLLRQVEQLLTTHVPFEGDLVMRQVDERVLQIRGTLLKDSHGRPFGAVVVLNDVSRLRRLENMRRDFAANVSHELRTPITSIKGFVETILDGASAEDSDRFLRIVARQADRLEAIIDDLLSLSKIEKEAESSDIGLRPTALYDVAVGAMHDCEMRAAERQVAIEIEGDAAVQSQANALLLQQAVRNLLENAVKYSEAGSRVRILIEQSGTEARIRVADDGCGIAPEHHDRLFERFYRVDKARSRKLGGTGLGLAIVKHIVLAHRGRVTVESAVGKGSTFTIHLSALPTAIAAPRQTA